MFPRREKHILISFSSSHIFITKDPYVRCLISMQCALEKIIQNSTLIRNIINITSSLQNIWHWVYQEMIFGP